MGDVSNSSDYEVYATQTDWRVSVEFNGVTIADSSQAILFREGSMAPVYYFPRADVRMDLMRRTRHKTHCPFKGDASYWSLSVGEKSLENVVWSYEKPIEEATSIKGYVAFYMDHLGTTYDEDSEYTQHIEAGGHGHSYVDWLLGEAWKFDDSVKLTKAFAEMLVANDSPVTRLSMFIRTLHPLVIGNAYIWRQEKAEINSFVLTHETLKSETFLDSPLAHIFSGAGGVRRRLEGDNVILDFGILRQLHEEGCTDYVAMPVVFTNGQINALTLATDKPGGFRTTDLGRIYEISPILSKLYEVHASQKMSSSLLQTYLGRETGERVLQGLIKRGDSEELSAVIWFCDLRQSTTLAESMDREKFIATLNQFFECMVRPILEYGGEVLQFIGDAVVAIFPKQEGDPSFQAACEEALDAAIAADERVNEWNVEREAENLPPIGFGIGLHVGTFTYGNIGIAERLEFTVIGSVANEAARIEGMTKELQQVILTSEEFANNCSNRLHLMGEFSLRGVESDQKLFGVK